MPSDLIEQLPGLLNLPDLIIIAAVLVNMILGFRRGFFGALSGLVGRIIALAAAYCAARAAAPYAARWVVTPIVGQVFENQAALSVSSGVLDTLRQTVTEAAVSMAFLLLLILFGILFGWLASVLAKSLRFFAHLTPLGILDSVAGGAVGFATGVILIALILLGIEFFSPITYSSLGWLSPERVSNTVLLAKLIDVLPVAI